MTVCTKKNRIWRNDLGDGVHYCFVRNCPNTIEVASSDRVLKIKWLGLASKSSNTYHSRKYKMGATTDE